MIFHRNKPVPTVLFSDMLHVLELVAIHGRGTNRPDLSFLDQVI